jgi:hypothetical protein
MEIREKPGGGPVCPEESTGPYLSVVATARNDNHGGNLLGRMQVFVDAWINQCKRHGLRAELILVEWNPPADKPGLAEALRWPADTGPCQVRIIQVPPEIHQRYRHAEALPLYQMIAKNVGIRRARGEFILVTNIDIVFSDEVVRFLADRKLQKGRIYRIDRHDVAGGVPVDGPLDDQLAYCRSHIIRLCAREEIFTLTPDGMRENEPQDIARPESGINFGSGWFKIDRWTNENFRWIRGEGEVFLRVPKGGGVLVLDMEPGPSVGAPPQPLQVKDESGTVVAEWMIAGRTAVQLNVPETRNGERRLIRLCAPTGGLPVTYDPRHMNFRFFRCDWAAPGAAEEIRPLQATYRANRHILARFLTSRRQVDGLLATLFRAPGLLLKLMRLMRMRGEDIFDAGAEYMIGSGWHALERTGDDRFRWAYYDTELKIRINEGRLALAMLVEPGPTLGFKPFDLIAQIKDGPVIGRARVDGLTYVEFALPIKHGEMTSVILNAESGGSYCGIEMPGDSRTLNYRVLACGRGSLSSRAPAKTAWEARVVGTRPRESDWQEELKESQREINEMGRPAFLHINACGDFTLMHRDDWNEVRAYAELDQFSMHLDSILCYAVHHLGIQEEMLAEPMRIYHIEHAAGSGWTPEGKNTLYERLDRQGIQYISFADLVNLVAQMRRLHAPMIFNLEDWGLAATELTETMRPRDISVPVAR